MSEPTLSLYEQIGGEKAIEGLVDAFYERVFADETLAPFFVSANIDKLRRMQAEFFSVALDGPIQYSGTSMSDAHHGRGIKRADFARFAELMLEALESFQLSEESRYQVISRINTYVDDIVGGGGLDG